MIPVQTAPGRCRLVHRCEAIEEVRDRSPQIGTTVQLGTLPATLIAMDFAAERQQFLALVPDRSSVDAITIVQGWRAGTR